MSSTLDEQFMREALRVATAKGSHPSVTPIGCVIVKDGAILAAERNRVEEDHDPTAHAEITAIRRACESLDIDAILERDCAALCFGPDDHPPVEVRTTIWDTRRDGIAALNRRTIPPRSVSVAFFNPDVNLRFGCCV